MTKAFCGCCFNRWRQRGRRADAAMRFATFRDRLRTDLDFEPSAETVGLVEDLRNSGSQIGKPLIQSDRPYVVVMPFEDLGGGETASFFARSLAADIAARIARTAWLSAMPPVGVQALDGDNSNPLIVARKLDAVMCLTGSARQLGERTRVSLQILDVAKGMPIWSHHEDIRDETAFDASDFLEGLTVNSIWNATRSFEPMFDVLEQLERVRDTPAAVERIMQELFVAAYQQEHSRHSLSHFDAATERALEYYPDAPFLLALRSAAVFSLAHISDAKSRFEAYRRSFEIARDRAGKTPRGFHLAQCRDAGSRMDWRIHHCRDHF